MSARRNRWGVKPEQVAPQSHASPSDPKQAAMLAAQRLKARLQQSGKLMQSAPPQQQQVTPTVRIPRHLTHAA
jgi:aminoglycoside/choline kinase family phosphotransferase